MLGISDTEDVTPAVAGEPSSITPPLGSVNSSWAEGSVQLAADTTDSEMSAMSNTTVERQMGVSLIIEMVQPWGPKPAKKLGDPEKSSAPAGLFTKDSGPLGGGRARAAVTTGTGAGMGEVPTSCAMPSTTGGSAAAP